LQNKAILRMADWESLGRVLAIVEGKEFDNVRLAQIVVELSE